jgi:hypothetical protein
MGSKKKQRTTSAARATIEASLQIALEAANTPAPNNTSVPVVAAMDVSN